MPKVDDEWMTAAQAGGGLIDEKQELEEELAGIAPVEARREKTAKPTALTRLLMA